MKKYLLFSLILCLFSTLFLPLTTAAADSQLIIINKATNELAFYENSQLERTFRVATGRDPSLTPEGSFIIVNKIVDRPYYKENIPGGDPANPLGRRWLGLDARGTWGTTYAIHGNNNPDSIGTYASAGCIRMHNNEIEWLFNKVKTNTPVIIVTSNQSFAEIASSHGYAMNNTDNASETAKTAYPLKLGSIGEEVKVLQQRLKELGYSIEKITEEFDKSTDKAVRAFQKDYGLTVDGIVGPKTKNTINNPPENPPTSNKLVDTKDESTKASQPTKESSKNSYPIPSEKVNAIQDNLRRLGYYNGDFDAYYGHHRPAKW